MSKPIPVAWHLTRLENNLRQAIDLVADLEDEARNNRGTPSEIRTALAYSAGKLLREATESFQMVRSATPWMKKESDR